ncbi:MAG: DUF4398 domain-containing protein [Pseudomonadota bacterium]
MHSSSVTLIQQRLRGAACAAGLLALGACASTPPAPTESLVAARSAVVNAEKAGAGQYAAMELGEAREKLAAADAAVVQKSMPNALRLAEQAHAEADLATARTGEAKAIAVNDEMKQGNKALVEELQRKTGEPK